jgi:hypothetical protein
MTTVEDLTSQPPTIEQKQLSAETYAPPHTLVTSFTTERGSVYTYDDEGHTSRFKHATGEQFEGKSITVFTKIAPEQEKDYLAATYPEHDNDDSVWVVERQEDNSGLTIATVEQVKHPDRLYLAIVRNGKIVNNVPATLMPTLGYDVFDTDVVKKDDGQLISYGHLGHKVASINYRGTDTPT